MSNFEWDAIAPEQQRSRDKKSNKESNPTSVLLARQNNVVAHSNWKREERVLAGQASQAGN